MPTDPASRSLPFLTSSEADRFSKVEVKSRPEDFVVEEVPMYEPSGEGTHSWFWIEKRQLNTHDAARHLARAIGKRPRDAGFAGLKDAQAVTRQWITFEHVQPERLQGIDAGPNLSVLEVSRHKNKLKKGHLRGNRFRIRMRHDDAPPLAERSRTVLSELRQRGVPNYYGPQRFGRTGGNPDLGALLVRGDEEGFVRDAESAGIPPPRARDKKLRRFMVNALQSSLFNRVLAERMPEIDELWEGDLAYLHRNGAVFAVEDLAAETFRCEQFEISPSGPIYGPKMKWPTGKTETLERRILTDAGLELEGFGRKEAQRQPGERRALRVPLLEEPEVAEDSEGVVVAFALPSGSYATVVLREILGDDPIGAIHAS